MADALPKMSEMDKGYFLGYAEALASRKEAKKEPTLNELRKKEVREDGDNDTSVFRNNFSNQ